MQLLSAVIERISWTGLAILHAGSVPMVSAAAGGNSPAADSGPASPGGLAKLLRYVEHSLSQHVGTVLNHKLLWGITPFQIILSVALLIGVALAWRLGRRLFELWVSKKQPQLDRPASPETERVNWIKLIEDAARSAVGAVCQSGRRLRRSVSAPGSLADRRR